MNIILISGNKRINLKISRWLISLIFGCLILIFSGFIYNVVNFTVKRSDFRKLPKLKRENRFIKNELERIKVAVTEINKMLDSLRTYDKKLRTYASLRPINEELRDMGVGGYTPTLDTLAPEKFKDLAMLSQNLDNLLARSRLQKKSFEEILKKLSEKKYLQDHTPSIAPVQGWFVSGFGYRIDPFTGNIKMHEGLDIAAPVGTPIVASADGVVKFVGRHGGYGLVIEIDHGYGFTTRFAHCQRIKVIPGMKVRRGDIIGYVGITGRSTGPHLHYEVWVSRIPVNPMNYILASPSIVD